MDRRKVAYAFGLLAFVGLLCLVLVEVVLRVYAGVAETSLAETLSADPYDVLIEPHGEAGYRPRPGRVVRYANGTEARINAMGFRGPTVAVPKPPGIFRIVLLGGSTTFGWGVADDATIDRHLRRILEERHPERSFEVVNLAFDGYDSYQLVERLGSDGLALDPDAVIVNSGVNDVSHAWFRDLRDADPRSLLYKADTDRLRFEAERGGPTLWTRAKHWLYLARLPQWLRSALDTANRRSIAPTLPQRTAYWDALDYFQRNLERVADLGTRSGSSAVLFSTPPSSLLTKYEPDQPRLAHYWLYDPATTQAYRDSLAMRMRGVATSRSDEGLPVAYVELPELPPARFLDDAHLDSEGNRRVAEAFADALEPWIRAHASETP